MLTAESKVGLDDEDDEEEGKGKDKEEEDDGGANPGLVLKTVSTTNLLSLAKAAIESDCCNMLTKGG